jgi:hypothetical protein
MRRSHHWGCGNGQSTSASESRLRPVECIDLEGVEGQQLRHLHSLASRSDAPWPIMLTAEIVMTVQKCARTLIQYAETRRHARSVGDHGAPGGLDPPRCPRSWKRICSHRRARHSPTLRWIDERAHPNGPIFRAAGHHVRPPAQALRHFGRTLYSSGFTITFPPSVLGSRYPTSTLRLVKSDIACRQGRFDPDDITECRHLGNRR